MKTTAVVRRKKKELVAMVEDSEIAVDYEGRKADSSEARRYSAIYSELRPGEKAFVELYKKDRCSLITCFNHGDEHWFRQHLMDPASAARKERNKSLTPYQKRVLKETEDPASSISG